MAFARGIPAALLLAAATATAAAAQNGNTTPSKDMCISSSLRPVPCGSREHVRRLQYDLNQLGFPAGVVDGLAGARTRTAMMAFLATTGSQASPLSQEADKRLFSAAGTAPRPFASSRPKTAVKRSATSTTKRATRSSTKSNPANGIFAGAVNAGNLVAQAGKTSGSVGRAPKPVKRPAGVPATTKRLPAFDVATAAAVPPRPKPLPTRVFSGPDQYPPKGYRGYGFLAFPARASEFDFKRHSIICQAFMHSLTRSTGTAVPAVDQFVTVWPLTDGDHAHMLNSDIARRDVAARCEAAIDHYDADRANAIISRIRADGDVLEGRGPFLFGWLPGNSYGSPEALILTLDLTRVENYQQALALLEDWKRDIESDEKLLRDGLSVESARRKLRNWADLHGEVFLSLLSWGD